MKGSARIPTRPSPHRILLKLLQRREVAHASSTFFIHPDREALEYLHFLYAILDDTDLLSKVSTVDLECVAALFKSTQNLAVEKRDGDRGSFRSLAR